MERISARQVGGLTVFLAIFMGVSYAAREYADALTVMLGGGGGTSMIFFIFLTIVFVVFVIPLDLALLIPLGVGIWGPLITALLIISGWTLGASVAFWIARRWGLPLVSSIVGESRVAQIDQKVPKDDLFWSVVLLRMLIPVDILSYALGLFSRISLPRYVLATALGVTPFGIYFCYVGALPWWYQAIGLLLAFMVAMTVLVWYRRPRQ